MREIKFRAWDGKKFIEPLVTGSGEVFKDWRDFEDGITTNSVLEQYIGLKDRNSKEIYEGDVVKPTGVFKLNGKQPKIIKRMFRKSKVIFHEGSFKLLGKSGRSGRILINGLIIKMYGLKVIGNIHENPELLDGKGE